MTDQQYGPYEFEVYVYSLEGRTLNYPVYFATRVYSHRRAQATYRGLSGQWPVAAATSRHLTQDSCGSAGKDGAIGNGFDEEGP
jgi:hypothetical protein